MRLPPVVALGPLALAANHYWALCTCFRTAAQTGVAPAVRAALSGLIESHARETWPAPIQDRATARLPALAAELERIELQRTVA